LRTGEEPITAAAGHDGKLRILLYYTTAGSEQHMGFLKCWPKIFANLPTLRHADVLVYDGDANTTTARLDEINSYLATWPNKAKTIRRGDNPGYEKGAMKAVDVAVENGWFDGYDWIIRLNPDVVIWDEGPLVANMKDNQAWGVFANCNTLRQDSNTSHRHSGRSDARIHTDFFAVRPEKIPKKGFATWNDPVNAEIQATRAFSDIVKAGADRWLLDHNRDHACRVRGGGLWHQNDECEDILRSKPWK
jgi:hypothetical protein